MFCVAKLIKFYCYFSPTVPGFGIYNDIYDLLFTKSKHLAEKTLGQLADSESCINGTNILFLLAVLQITGLTANDI